MPAEQVDFDATGVVPRDVCPGDLDRVPLRHRAIRIDEEVIADVGLAIPEVPALDPGDFGRVWLPLHEVAPRGRLMNDDFGELAHGLSNAKSPHKGGPMGSWCQSSGGQVGLVHVRSVEANDRSVRVNFLV